MNHTVNLLFVDDEEGITNALRRLLRQQPWTCHFRNSGSEALALMQDQPMDLIVSDMRMPGMDGATFLAAARERQPEAVRFLMTGQADMEDTIKALNEGGISRFIAKPWSDVELVRAIEEGLRIKLLERERDRLLTETLAQQAELRSLNAGLELRVAERTRALQERTVQLDRSQSAIMEVFSAMLSSREHLIKGSSRRVAEVCRLLCIALKLDAVESRDIHRAAMLHEIGKLALPEELLKRSETGLTAYEHDEYMQYALHGEHSLTGVPDFERVAQIIRHHNENVDGLGFPDRLKGNDIPLGARVLKVARDFIGHQSRYLSKVPQTPEQALVFMRHQMNKRYDASIVEALCYLYESRQDLFADIAERTVTTRDAQVGERLVKDVVSKRGILLVPHNTVLTPHILNQLRKIEQSEGEPFNLHVASAA